MPVKMHPIDPTTGRPIYSGPQGEAGSATQFDPRAVKGEYGWYIPGQHMQVGNREALGLSQGPSQEVAPNTVPNIQNILASLFGNSAPGSEPYQSQATPIGAQDNIPNYQSVLRSLGDSYSKNNPQSVPNRAAAGASNLGRIFSGSQLGKDFNQGIGKIGHGVSAVGDLGGAIGRKLGKARKTAGRNMQAKGKKGFNILDFL